jgi:hypothetical protein
MILRRKRIALIRCDLISTALTTIDARIRAVGTWLVEGIVLRMIRLA